MIWGIGSALMEENVVDLRYGSFLNQDLASYHVAVNADVGEMDVMFLDEEDPYGSPLGSKIRDFPARPDKLLAALEALDS